MMPQEKPVAVALSSGKKKKKLTNASTKKVRVAAPHISYKDSPAATLLGLHESSAGNPLLRGR